MLHGMLCPISTVAQTDSVLRKHVVFAFDDALPSAYMLQLLNGEANITMNAERLLKRNNVMPSEADYISVINFGLGIDNKSLKDFAAPSKDSKGDIAWREFNGLGNLFGSQWKNLVYNQGVARSQGARFSLLSGAKAFVMESLKGKNVLNDSIRAYANRTYLLLVTDDYHNGNDNFIKEFEVFKSMGARVNEKEFREVCNEFSHNFLAELMDETILATGGELPYRLMLYEIRPAATAALAGIVNYPASLNLKRVPGGYSMEFDASSAVDFYSLMKMEVETVTTNGDTVKGSAAPIAPGQPLHFNLKLDKKEIDEDHVPVTVRAWLLQNDSIYDAYLLNPYDPHVSRLSSTGVLKCHDKGTVFGIPLPDAMWWFSRDDIRMAAFIWEVIFILILVIAVVITIIILNKRSLRYVPTNNEFSIRRAGAGKGE